MLTRRSKFLPERLAIRFPIYILKSITFTKLLRLFFAAMRASYLKNTIHEIKSKAKTAA